MSDTVTTAGVHYQSDGSSPRTASRSTALTDLRQQAGALRDEVELLTEDVGNHHQQLQTHDLRERASAMSRRGAKALLEELSVMRGMSWRDIARVSGVSASAVRKWRAGESPSPERRMALAVICAVVDLLQELPIEDPAAWLEVQVLPGYTVTGMDLLREGRYETLLDYAGQRLTPRETLDRFDADWRTKYSQDFEVFSASDGSRAIRRAT